MMNAILLFLFIILLFSFVNFISTTTYSCDPSISCGCSIISTVINARIVGGEIAPNHAWGWMISFQLNGTHRCGASLLTPEYAVTAGHCVSGILYKLRLFSILAGTNYLNDKNNATVQRRSVIKITLHPNYSSKNVINDIAIIRFSPLNISSGSNLGFICLPKANVDPFQINSNVIAIGWGHLATGTTDLSNELRQVTIKIISTTSTACQNTDFSNADVHFCAGVVTGGKDTCDSDSGGPLMAFVNNSWVLAGITSLGKKCAVPNVAAVYTRVSSFISFINSTIESSASENITDILTTPSSKSELITTRNNKSLLILVIGYLFLMFFFFSY